ncbi:MAG: Na+/H+ antiporter NhaA [Bacteroidota bacterium]
MRCSPIVAAAGGMLFPALIHFIFNAGTATQPGFGIPMATDIAFALGILSLAATGCRCH